MDILSCSFILLKIYLIFYLHNPSIFYLQDPPTRSNLYEMLVSLVIQKTRLKALYVQ